MASPPSPSSSSTTAHEEQKNETPGLGGFITDRATSDLQNILGGSQFLLVLLDVPLELALGIGFLYFVLGWAAFAGLGAMLLLLPVPAFLSSLMARAQERKMKATDARVQAITEGVGVLRMLKLSGWEGQMVKEVRERREEELKEEWRLKWVDAVNNIVSFAVPLGYMVVSYAVFVGLLFFSVGGVIEY
jgi:ABC-type multidrug transport system fused ATPase/permease subunit